MGIQDGIGGADHDLMQAKLSTGSASLDVWSVLVIVGLAVSSTAAGAFGYRLIVNSMSADAVRLFVMAVLATLSSMSLLILSRRRPSWAALLGSAAMLVFVGRVFQTELDSPVRELLIAWAVALLALCGTVGDWPNASQSGGGATA